MVHFKVLNSIHTKTNNIYDTDHFRYPTDPAFMNQNRMKRRRSSSSSSSDFEQSKGTFQGIRLYKKRRKAQSVSAIDDLGAQSTQIEEVNGNQKLCFADCVESNLEESKKVIDAETGIQTVEKRRRKRKKKMREENQIEIPPLYVIHK